MTFIIALGWLVGLLISGAIIHDAFEVMLVPRRVTRRRRFTRYYYRWGWRLWARVARVTPEGARRERFLSVFGSLSMTLLFTLWATLLIVAFGLMQWSAAQTGAHRSAPGLGEQIYLSGVTFFTLGFGDLTPQTSAARALAVLEAGVGFGLIAVVIGYLPVLYQLFSRREAHVLQLDARAGSPPTAVKLLARHAESRGLDKVDDLLRTWEIWAAELLESHLSYPMLAYYRSQHDDQSWLGALVAIMDTCALILVGVEDVAPLQARMTFAMARQVVLEMARSLEVVMSRAAETTRLPTEDFQSMLAVFAEAGLTWNGGEAAEATLSAVRATYEPLAQALADHLLIPIPGWTSASDATDHWHRGTRGVIARRLVDGLSDGSISQSSPLKEATVRARLRPAKNALKQPEHEASKPDR